MATRKIINPSSGKPMEADVVEVLDITDPPTRISLEDGSELRLKLDVVEILRLREAWDNEGHPQYVVKSGTHMAVLDSPDHLKKPSHRSSGTRN